VKGAVIEPNSHFGQNLGFAIKRAKDTASRTINLISRENISFYYGHDDQFVEITNKVLLQCIIFFEDRITIQIPPSADVQDAHFGDPFPYIHKVIKICRSTTEYFHNEYEEIKFTLFYKNE
jgi:hypothetical protein